MMDYSRLRLRRSPNQYLVAPPGATADPPHRVAPVFAMSVEKLAAQFRSYALSQPRVKMLKVSDDGRDLELVQRSKVFRFPDYISTRFLALPNGRSTLIVYSRARYGYRDFGVNRKRIEAWLAALGAPVADNPAG